MNSEFSSAFSPNNSINYTSNEGYIANPDIKWNAFPIIQPNGNSKPGEWYLVVLDDGTLYFADWDDDLKCFTNPRCEYTSKLTGIVSWATVNVV